jgi:hypothetical protein
MIPARFCIHCGRERLLGASFCAGCGWEFDTLAAPPVPLAAELLALPPAEPELLPAEPYPIAFRLAEQPAQRRVTVIFRLPLAIPHVLLWLALAVFSTVLAIISWPLALAIGRLPRPLHRFQAAVLGYVTRVAAYLCLADDRWPAPPWRDGAGGPVAVTVAPPLPLSRLRTLAVPLLAIPAMITAILFGVVAWMLGVGAWFAIIAIGRLPRPIHDMLDLSLGFQARTLGYFPLLLTGVYPWFEHGPLLLPSRR